MELNVMMPILAYCLLESIDLEAKAVKILSEKCVKGIKVNKEKCQYYAEISSALATAISPLIGYDKVSWIVKEASRRGKTIREVLIESNLVPKDKLEQALDLKGMTKGGRIV